MTDAAVVEAVASQARQVVWSGRGPQLIENRDLLTTAYLGADEGMDPGDNTTVPVDPLGSKSFDGSGDWWARTVTGAAQLVSIPGGTGSQVSPILIAEQLAAAGLATAANQLAQETSIPANMLAAGQGVTTELAALIASGSPAGSPGGVPLLSFLNLLGSGSAVALPLGSTTLFTSPVGQPSYEGLMQVWTATAPSTVQIQVNWQLGGFTIQQENYWIYAGTVGAPHGIYLKGPCKGATMQVICTVANACTITYEVYQSSHVHAFDLWRSQFSSSFDGETAATWDVSADILAGNAGVALAAGAGQTTVLPLWTGKVVLAGSTTSGAGDMQFIVNPVTDGVVGIGSVPVLIGISSGAGYVGPTEFFLPRAQCSLTINNKNAATKTLDWCLTAAEY